MGFGSRAPNLIRSASLCVSAPLREPRFEKTRQSHAEAQSSQRRPRIEEAVRGRFRVISCVFVAKPAWSSDESIIPFGKTSHQFQRGQADRWRFATDPARRKFVVPGSSSATSAYPVKTALSDQRPREPGSRLAFVLRRTNATRASRLHILGNARPIFFFAPLAALV